MDDDFVIGYIGFIKSFLHYNKWFDYDFIVFDLGISDENKKKMLSYYDKIQFRKIQKKNYSDVNMSGTQEKLKNTYYTLDVFLLSEYDRIVFLDMDLIVLGDISELFTDSCDFGACYGYNAKADELRTDFNSGVFSVSKKWLNKDTYKQLLRIIRKGFSMPDQKCLNRFFRGKTVFYDKIYNVEKRMLHSVKHKSTFKRAVILHFIAEKPWQKEKSNDIERSFGDVEKIWWEWYLRGNE